jgi:hypothetical protein
MHGKRRESRHSNATPQGQSMRDGGSMFYDFHKGDLPLYSLNFGIITLLPKCEEAIRIKQYNRYVF